MVFGQSHSSTAHTTTVCRLLNAPKIQNPPSFHQKQRRPPQKGANEPNAFLTVDRSQTCFRSRTMTISREISSEKEFDAREDQIFNSREFAKTFISQRDRTRFTRARVGRLGDGGMILGFHSQRITLTGVSMVTVCSGFVFHTGTGWSVWGGQRLASAA